METSLSLLSYANDNTMISQKCPWTARESNQAAGGQADRQQIGQQQQQKQQKQQAKQRRKAKQYQHHRKNKRKENKERGRRAQTHSFVSYQF